MSLSTLIKSQTLQNIVLSGAYLYGSKLFVKSMDTKLATKYSIISNSILPLGTIFCLYMSKEHLKLVSQFPMQGFLKYILKMYTKMYTGRVIWSMITFTVGYPTINIFYFMIRNYFKNVFSSRLIETSEHIGDMYVKIFDALQNNRNWDITYRGISFKTMEVAKPFINQEALEQVAPLRMRSKDNVSEFKYDHNCNICTEEIDSNKMHRELPCKHVFHPECVDKWLLERDDKCPMCREPVV